MIRSGWQVHRLLLQANGTLREPYVDSWSSPGQKPQPHMSRPLCGWSWFASIRQGMITGTLGLAPSKAALKISPGFRYVCAVDIVFPSVNQFMMDYLSTSVNRRTAAVESGGALPKS